MLLPLCRFPRLKASLIEQVFQQLPIRHPLFIHNSHEVPTTSLRANHLPTTMAFGCLWKGKSFQLFMTPEGRHLMIIASFQAEEGVISLEAMNEKLLRLVDEVETANNANQKYVACQYAETKDELQGKVILSFTSPSCPPTPQSKQTETLLKPSQAEQHNTRLQEYNRRLHAHIEKQKQKTQIFGARYHEILKEAKEDDKL